MSWSRPRALLGHAAAGLFLGLSRQAPSLWPLAVVSGVLWAFVIAKTPRRGVLVAGIVLSQLLSHALWLRWSFAMADVFFPGQPSTSRGLALGFIAIEALPTTVMLVMFGTLSWRRVPVRIWFPIAWTIGELFQWELSNITVEWLAIFQNVGPVLRTVGRFGLVPSLLAFLFVLTSAGEALAERRRAVAIPAAALLAFLLVFPARREGDRSGLERIGVVHMANDASFPSLDGLDVDLAIWPEATFVARPMLGEGPAKGAHFETPLGGPTTRHLAGLLTQKGARSYNAAVAIEPGGEITSVRAKQVLFPVTERKAFGVGQKRFHPGEATPLLQVGGRKVIPLVCFEFMARHLVERGRDAGGEIIAVLSSERFQAFSEVAASQVRGIAALRAAEFHLPIVYSSIEGHGWILSAEGRVLAEGDRYASGVLTWSAAGGAVDHRPEPHSKVTVLYSLRTPDLRVDCPPGACEYVAVETMRCDGRRRDTVVASGHSQLPQYLAQDAEALADKLTCLQPDLIVLDTCFGASTPILAALARRTSALVIAAPDYVSGLGFRYRPPFFAGGPLEERAAAVERRHGTVTRWKPNLGELASLEQQALDLDHDSLRARLRSWNPTLIALHLGDQQEVLVPIDWKRAR